jgi:hypoxanthine phosphoribosyltransferase
MANRSRAITYDDAYQLSCRFDQQIRSAAPQSVIGIARGGVVPAVMLAQRHGLPLAIITKPRGQASSWSAGRLPEHERVLLVDDIVASGDTMAACAAFLAERGNHVITCALFYDEQCEARGRQPDIGVPASQFIRYPWDALDSTPQTSRHRQQHGTVSPAEEQPFVALCVDALMPGALDHVPEWILRLPADNLCVVTTAARQAVAAWLETCGLRGITVHALSPEASIDEKTALLDALDVSACVHGTLQEALEIATQCPVIDVYWAGRDKAYRLGGISVPSSQRAA